MEHSMASAGGLDQCQLGQAGVLRVHCWNWPDWKPTARERLKKEMHTTDEPA